MANTFGSISSQAGILKTVFQGPLKSQFNDEVPIFRGAAQGQHPWVGQQVNRPLKLRRNQGIGATTDGGVLPKVGRQLPVQATILAKYNYLRFGITGPLIAASKNDTGAFVRGVKFELSEGYSDLKVDCGRQFSWDGTGDLARVNTAASGSSVLVIKGREDNEPALKFIDVDLSFDIYTSAGVLVQSGITVSSISSGTAGSTTATLVCDQAITCSANDILIRAGTGVSGEIQGLLTQLDGGTSTVYGIDRSLYVQSQGNVVYNTNDGTSTGTSLAFSLDAMQRVQDEAERRGGSGVNAFYCDYSTRRMFNKLIQVDRRYQSTTDGKGGFANKGETYLAYNGIPIVADQACPVRMFALPKDDIEKYVLSEMDFADEQGEMLIAQTDTDAYEARVRFFMNLFNSKAAASAVLTSYVAP